MGEYINTNRIHNPDYAHTPAAKNYYADTPYGELEQARKNVFADLPLAWSVFRRRIGLFTGAFIATLALVVIVTFQMTPIYQATSLVEINNSDNEPELLKGFSLDSNEIETQIELIQARDLIKKFVEKNDLINDPEFNPSKDAGSSSGLKGFVKKLLPGQLSAQTDPDKQKLLETAAVINLIENRISIERKSVSRAIDVSFKSPDPEKAALLVNSYVDTFIELQLERKF